MAKRYLKKFVPALSETVKFCEKRFQVLGSEGPEIGPTVECLKKPTRSDLEFRSRIELMDSRLEEARLKYHQSHLELVRSVSRSMREERQRNRPWNRLLRWIRGLFGARQ